MKYFAYGSNLLLSRLRERTPSAKVIAKGMLFDHKLMFHKKSHDGSGKCDAFQIDNSSDSIYGVIYEIHESDKCELDIEEGLGFGYEEKEVSIYVDSPKTLVDAFTYYATDIETNLSPYHWYKDFVLHGAIENNLPEEYIEMIRKVSSIDDADVKRTQYNQNILLGSNSK